MDAPRSIGLCLLVLGLVAPGPVRAAADDPSLLGTWRIVRFEAAPWVQSSPDLIDRGLRFRNARLRFQPDRIEAPDPFGCRDAHYDSRSVPPQGLFQGNLKDEKQAARLGLARDSIPTVGVQCDTGTFDFHFVDANKAMTALDNLIYVLARQPEEQTGRLGSVKAACPPWYSPPVAPKVYSLASVAVVNDPPTLKEPPAPATLHPDTEATEGELLVQTWDLAAYRDHPIYLRCRYEGTSVTGVEPVPDDATECRMSVGWNPKRRRIDARISPLVLECR